MFFLFTWLASQEVRPSEDETKRLNRLIDAMMLGLVLAGVIMGVVHMAG